MRKRCCLLSGAISDFQKIIRSNLYLWFSKIKRKRSSWLDVFVRWRQTITFQRGKTFDTYVWLELSRNSPPRALPQYGPSLPVKPALWWRHNLKHPDCPDSPLRLLCAPAFSLATPQGQVWRGKFVLVGMILLVSLKTTPQQWGR